MMDQIIIGVDDKETADAIQRELAARSILANRPSRGRKVAFTGRFGAGPVYADLTSKEFLEIARGIVPTAVDSIFDTLERFRDRVKLFINGELKELPARRYQPAPQTMEEWLQGIGRGP